jgi:ankyrin repeat protein
MKNNTNSSPLNPALKKDLNLTLINAVENPRGEAPYEDGLTEMVAGLLARGADVNAESPDGDTALILAALNGHTEIVAQLLARGAYIEAKTSDGYYTALMIAALNGHTEIVAQLLARGAYIEAKTSDGYTALFLAALNGHTETVALLSDQKADVNARTNYGHTALMIAAGNGHTEIVAQLLNKGADVNAESPDGDTALILAALNGHTEIVAQLLARGAYIEAKTSDGDTALILAALNGHTEIVAKLLARGADVNARAPDGFTALMIAAANGHTEIVAQLLNKGADVNAESDGYTALMLAAKRGHTETVLALLPRNDADWQIVQDQLRHPALRNLNKEVSVVLAITLPEGELRNSIITSFNQRNPNNQINQENNNILGAGIEAYKTLKDLKSWHVRYLADSGCPENEVRNLADQRFFDLLNHQDARQGALARNDLVMDLVSKSGSLAIDSVFGDEEALVPVRGLNPEDFYKLTTKIIDKSRDEHGIPRLEALSLVAALRKDRADQSSDSPDTTMHRKSIVPIAPPKNPSFSI